MRKMKKTLRTWLCMLLTLALIMPSMIMPQTIASAGAKDDNLALGKPVTVSGVEGGTLENGSLRYPQFVETNLVDGNGSTRWSSDISLTSLDLAENPDQNVWAYVDLGQEYQIGSIVMKWQNANSRDYDVQISNDANEWTVLKNYVDPDNTGIEYTETLNIEDGVTARYVRVYARLGTVIAADDNYECSTISLYELEVYEYSTMPSMSAILAGVLEKQPTANEDYTQLILPEADYEGYSVKLYATSNPSVITLDGQIIRPLEDMKVNLFYELTAPDGTTLKGDDPQKVVITGLYSEEESINEKPDVVPEIREWKGNEGTFTYTGNLVVADESLRATAEQIAMYFEEMFDRTSTIAVGTPAAGDIYFAIDEACVLGEEGYAMDIDDILTVTAKTEKGILYGGTSISQILTQAEDHMSIAKGLVRDYPQYEVRAVMLDVARLYIPFEHLEEMTKYAAYFKLSEFRNHINETGGEQPSSFRIESKVYPQLNEGLICYTQDEYREYQKEAKKFGIDVVTEIDTPAHAGAFGKIDSSLMMDSYHMDLRTEEAFNRVVAVMKEVFDEFLDGDDPVFQSSKFHIGTDEYNKAYSERVRMYMDEMIKYVNSKDLECRFWASLGTNGFVGETPVSTDAVAHMWSHNYAGFEEMKDDGYKFINNAENILYIVPWVSYNNYLDIKNLYNTWEYSNLERGYYLAAGHPQLLGAEAALWNDTKVGASEFDIFDRFRDQIMLMAEKGWYGENDDETGDDFMARVEAVGARTPQANPARFVESATSLVASYDFETAVNGVVTDASGNGYDGTMNGTYIKDGALRLNGEGSLSLPFDSIGYPYTAQFDVTVDLVTPENAVIFDGKDGTLFYNYDGTGCLGFERKGYSYIFDYQMPAGVNTTITLTCDAENTKLYINGLYIATAQYYKVTDASEQASSTFVLPVEEIGSGIYGKIDNLKLYNYTMNDAEISDLNGFDSFENVIAEAKEAVAAIEITEANQAFIDSINYNIAKLEAMLSTDQITEMNLLRVAIQKQLQMLEEGKIPVVADKSELDALLAVEIDLNSFSTESRKAYEQAVQFGKNVLYNAEVDQSLIDYACDLLRDTMDNSISGAYVVITTNKQIYQDYTLDRLIDNDTASLTWLQEGQTEGDYVLFSFRDIQKLSNIKIYATDAGSDVLVSGKVEISLDGEKWTEAAAIGGKTFEDVSFAETDVRYVKLSVIKTVDYWWKLTEVVFNNTAIQDKSLLEQELAVEVDASLYTDDAYAAYVQAKEAAQAVYDDEASSQIQIEQALKALVDARGNIRRINKAELQSLIDNKLDASGYTKESYAAYKEAYEAGLAVLEDENAVQYDVNLAVWKIKEAISLLVEDDAPTELKIITQPQDVVAAKGADAITFVEAEGDGLVYTWYYKNPGNVKFYLSGDQFVTEGGAAYSIPMFAWRDGQQVYCVITDEYGNSVQTNTVTLTMTPAAVTIVTPPADYVAAEAGEVAKLTVVAKGEGLTYTWYYKNPGNVKFYVSGEQFVSDEGATYSIPVQAWRDGQQVYCEITDAAGNSVQTDVVTISLAK